jgi:hypothetical protein
MFPLLRDFFPPRTRENNSAKNSLWKPSATPMARPMGNAWTPSAARHFYPCVCGRISACTPSSLQRWLGVGVVRPQDASGTRTHTPQHLCDSNVLFQLEIRFPSDTALPALHVLSRGTVQNKRVDGFGQCTKEETCEHESHLRADRPFLRSPGLDLSLCSSGPPELSVRHADRPFNQMSSDIRLTARPTSSCDLQSAIYDTSREVLAWRSQRRSVLFSYRDADTLSRRWLSSSNYDS